MTLNRACGWFVHLFTSSSIIVGLMTLFAIQNHEYKLAFILMGIAVVIDACDGTLARYFNVKTTVPEIDGALLDNIADFINYVMTPCYLLITHPNLMPTLWASILSSAIIVASAFQFCQVDAKTEDCFFKGFPSYWNFVVFYMYLFKTQAITNIIATICLLLLVFIPIKYIYLSRMQYVTHSHWIRQSILVISIIFGALNIAMLYLFPNYPDFCFYLVIAYFVFYFGFSLYRTFNPLKLSD